MPLPIQRHLDATAARPSREQRRFQSLLEQIDQARQHLQAWQTQLPVFAQRHARHNAPLLAALAAARRALAFELEALRAGPRWTRAERATMSAMICAIAGTLLDAVDADDAELKNLFDRHAEVAYDRQGQHELASMQALFESIGGFDFGERPVESADELLQRAQAQLSQDREAARRQRKPPRQTAAQRRAEEDQRRISQTVREVYRKLASTLHPDRMPADLGAAERAARIEQMQRANRAYEAGDLLALLELQLQIEQVDIAHAAGVAAEQLRHFNKVLAGQLQELRTEIDGLQQAFCASYGLLTQRRIDPDKLGVLLKEEARAVNAEQLLVDMQRRALKAGGDQARRMLRQWRADQRRAELDDRF